MQTRIRLWIVIALASLAAGCAAGGSDSANEAVTAEEAVRLVASGDAILVDVREESEIRSGMAAPAIWMPSSKIGPDSPAWREFVDGLAPEQIVIVYCESGARSKRAAELLVEQGFTASNLGGLSAWKEAGLPIQTPEHPEVGR